MLNSIEEAIKEIKNGKVVIVVDDENRENEGDFVAASELITPEIINFMCLEGRGLICTPIPEDRCKELGLELMVGNNTDPNETAFTVSIDLIGNGVTTGISASDRAKTIRAMMNPNIKPMHFTKPGHIFPLKACSEGVLRRPGHTEAAVDLARLAGLTPGGVIVEIMNEDGTMARLKELLKIAKKFDIKIISIKDLIEYRLQKDSLIEYLDNFIVSTVFGDFDFFIFHQKFNERMHFALKKGNWNKKDNVLVRVVSSFLFNNFFDILFYGDLSLKKIIELINKEGKGLIVFINHDINFNMMLKKINKFKVDLKSNFIKQNFYSNKKDLGIGLQIIKSLGIKHIKLITNKPTHIRLKGFGLEIKEFINF